MKATQKKISEIMYEIRFSLQYLTIFLPIPFCRGWMLLKASLIDNLIKFYVKTKKKKKK